MRATGINVHLSSVEVDKLHKVRNLHGYTTMAEAVRHCLEVTFDKEIVLSKQNQAQG